MHDFGDSGPAGRNDITTMIRWAAHRPAVACSLFAGLLIACVVAFTRLPLAAKNSVDFPRLTVTASWTGASPELAVTYLTAPLESVVQGVHGVHQTRSKSAEGRAT